MMNENSKHESIDVYMIQRDFAPIYDIEGHKYYITLQRTKYWKMYDVGCYAVLN